jgi:GGDEF domain-containing protein
VETARSLTAAAREGDLVCRIGGDEFAFVTAGDRSSGMGVADRIVNMLRSAIVWEGRFEEVRAIVGSV